MGVHKIVSPFIARSRNITLFAPARSIGVPVFPACRFFPFGFLRTSGTRLFFACGKTSSLHLSSSSDTADWRVLREAARDSFILSSTVEADFDHESPFSLSLSLSLSNGTVPVDLNEFFPFGVGRLLLPFSRSAGQPSLVSLEIFCPMNSCGSSGRSGCSIHCFDRSLT